MPNWAWLLVGAAGGYVLAHAGGNVRLGLSFTPTGRGAPPRGSGSTPLDQPTGSEPYQTIGAYNPLFGSGYPDLIDPGANARIVNGGGYD